LEATGGIAIASGVSEERAHAKGRIIVAGVGRERIATPAVFPMESLCVGFGGPAQLSLVPSRSARLTPPNTLPVLWLAHFGFGRMTFPP
jgi:hypothetical protein